MDEYYYKCILIYLMLLKEHVFETNIFLSKDVFKSFKDIYNDMQASIEETKSSNQEMTPKKYSLLDQYGNSCIIQDKKKLLQTKFFMLCSSNSRIVSNYIYEKWHEKTLANTEIFKILESKHFFVVASQEILRITLGKMQDETERKEFETFLADFCGYLNKLTDLDFELKVWQCIINLKVVFETHQLENKYYIM